MALSPITINGATIRQPSTLRESRDPQQTDHFALDGTAQRTRVSSPNNPVGYKYVAILTWQNLPLTDFQTLNALLNTTGSGIVYNNPSSKYGTLTYSGLPTVTEGDYVAGESLMTSFSATIRQI